LPERTGKIELEYHITFAVFISREIQEYFRQTSHLLPNSSDGNHWIDVDCDRKVFYDWVTHVKEVGDNLT
jgi:hypothetical protein